ncbi:unnamed protein product [Tilletia caries]|uniref:Uncharacterized protein n=4 Tax=Tilletia TaxID=13289 RepID=A0A8X7MKR6_9BASI|nr:hypothetical protein CF335_g7138 [Tilletia laevis]KAE8239831.1 hypothetical protein A4X06_0g8018 [Tilletia controversa]CAD6893836.1 unnamed protein product [Tilletia caries]CAD6902291.1 unnamed protein product [Tilletia caries]CAD6937179.1 unnamed protein product [Tilletia controversa]
MSILVLARHSPAQHPSGDDHNDGAAQEQHRRAPLHPAMTTSKKSSDDDVDEMLAHAKQHFPENPFADASAHEPQPQPHTAGMSSASASTSANTAETPAIAASIGDKNPFRAHIAAGASSGILSPQHTAASGSTAGRQGGTGAFNLAGLNDSLPRPPAVGEAPAPATAASSGGPAQTAAQAPSEPTVRSEISAAEASSTAIPSPPTYAPDAPSPLGAPSATASTYAPPVGPPPEHRPDAPDRIDSHRRAASTNSSHPSHSSAHVPPPQAPAPVPAPAPMAYVPTNVPTPGAPLLRKGKLLVYPRGMAECHKCHNTGYKFDDPTHPCRGCWSRYGDSVNSILHRYASFDRVPGVLQSPLPIRSGPSVGVHRPYDGSHRPSASAGYPGAMASTNTYRYMDNAYDGGFGHGIHTAVLPAWLRDPQPQPQRRPSSSTPAFQPPPGPPGPQPPSTRPAPAQDEARAGGRQRTDAEPTGDEGVSAEGEVPPSYDEAVSAAADGRTLNPQHVPPRPHGLPTSNRPHVQTGPAPPPPPRPAGYGAYNAGPQSPYGAPHHPHNPHAPYQPHQHAPSNPPVVGPPEAPYGFAPVSNVHFVDSRRRPPAGALVVRPGDPRIGGRLCLNCGGEGSVTASFLDSLFGAPDEQCYACRGSGRVFR